MAKLLDKLYNRVIEGKLKLENGDDIKKEVEESLKDSDLNVKSITAKEMVEEGDTQLIDISDYLNPDMFKDKSMMYAKLMVKHNVLHIIVSGCYIAGTSAGSNPSILTNFGSVLTDFIKDRIYRADGTKLSENPITEVIPYKSAICGTWILRNASTVGSAYGILASSSINNIRLDGYVFGTIAEDTQCYIDIRIALTL